MRQLDYRRMQSCAVLTTKHRPKRLLDQVRDAIRLKHYMIRTEESCVTWIKRYILFYNKRPSLEMASAEIEPFPTHLAVEQKVAVSTQDQVLSALLFLYGEVLKTPLDLPIEAVRAKKAKRWPTVLTKEETLQVIEPLSGPQRLMAKLLYGGGLRLMECLRLRVKDLDFAPRQIIVCDGKGLEERINLLPESLIVPLQAHVAHVKRLHAQDVAQGVGRVY
jgi:integrase